MFESRKQAGKMLEEKLIEKGIVWENSILVGISEKAMEVMDGFSNNFKKVRIVIEKMCDDKGRILGGIGESGAYFHKQMIEELEIDENEFNNNILMLRQEITKKEHELGIDKVLLTDKEIVLVDDGANTGERVIAACREVWKYNPLRLVVALPVCNGGVIGEVEKECDSLVCVVKEGLFFRVSQFYEE